MNDKNFVGNSRSCIDFLGNEWNYDCMGCSVTSGDIKLPGGFIYDGKYCVLGCDPEIPIPGFLIVNTKRHINSFSELSRDERIEIGDVIACAEKALKEIGIVDKVTLVQEERSRHLHIWIFPNYEWMNEKFGKGISYLREISEYCIKNCTSEDVSKVLDVISSVKNYFNKNFKDGNYDS